jgi:phage shock protein PspC (stress-responsive transcriptional regulator)
MKEVSLIHIAKTKYYVEISAKKELEKYIQSLAAYADDESVLEDIEIRITELLAGRNINQDDVITNQDVAAIRARLGEPKDFLASEDVAIGLDEELSTKPVRKLFRNTDDAVFGGVLSGTATFFHIRAMWLRLIFILLAVFSFGIFLAIYILLWIVLPPARTVTEKLQLRGKAVTLASLRAFSENSDEVADIKRREAIRKSVFGMVVGLIGLGGLIGSLIVTAVSVFILLNVRERIIWGGYSPVIYSLFIASGLFLAILFGIVAYGGFSRKVSKKLVTAGIIITIVGMLTFASGVAMLGYQSWQRNDAVQRSIKNIHTDLSKNFENVTDLTINAGDINVLYIVDTTPHMDYQAAPGTHPIVSQNGQTATVSISSLAATTSYTVQPILKIYGPQLMKITVVNGQASYTSKSHDLQVTTQNNSSLDITGSVDNLTITTADASTVTAGDGAIESVIVTMESGTSIQLGNIKTLNVTQPTACPTYSPAELSVANIATHKMTYGGIDTLARSYNSPCGVVTVGEDNQG